MGFDDLDYKDRPVVAILNTWSELNTCHSHFRNRAEEVRRGILQSGGFPVEVPVMSLGEMLMKPTTMLYRNLLAMEVEEVLRCHPIDSAVLMGGCDKTVPAMEEVVVLPCVPPTAMLVSFTDINSPNISARLIIGIPFCFALIISGFSGGTALE